MSSVRTWSLPGGIQLRLASAFPWTNDWLEGLGDLPELPSPDGKGASVTIDLSYIPELPLTTAREVEDGIYISPDGIIDRQHGVVIGWSERGDVILRARDPALEWFIVASQLALLRIGRVLVHSAGVAKDDRAVVFPSWGGVGKTGLVTRLVRERGWRLLGDDLVILDTVGNCYGFPKPMVLYPYHRPLFPEVFGSGRGPVAPVGANRALTRAAIWVKPLLRPFPSLLQLARRHNPQSVRIKPSAVFGMDSLGLEARLNAVLFLEREAGIAQVSVARAEHGLAGRILGTTLNEFNPRCVKVCHVAMGAGLLSPRHFFSAWLDILDQALSGVDQFVVRVPDGMPVEQMSEAVAALLHGELRLGRISAS
jgi:hypothetical protein